MNIRTGQTIYECIASIDIDNSPISAATLTAILYNNSMISLDVVNYTLIDDVNAVFSLSWSATSFGNYQLYVKNNTTKSVYMSNVYFVVSDDEITTIVYVGI